MLLAISTAILLGIVLNIIVFGSFSIVIYGILGLILGLSLGYLGTKAQGRAIGIYYTFWQFLCYHGRKYREQVRVDYLKIMRKI